MEDLCGNWKSLRKLWEGLGLKRAAKESKGSERAADRARRASGGASRSSERAGRASEGAGRVGNVSGEGG